MKGNQTTVGNRHELDVEVVSGSSVISIRTKADLKDIWSDVRLGRKVMTASKKRKSKKRKADASDPENYGKWL